MILGIDILYNVRSRNVEVVGKRLKPNTRYYVFMENVDMTDMLFLNLAVLNKGIILYW